MINLTRAPEKDGKDCRLSLSFHPLLHLYISTVRKHATNVLSALEQVFTGTSFGPHMRDGSSF